VGVGLSLVLERLLQMPTSVSLLPVLIAFGSAVMIGVFFGIYPARRAAELNPIQALQYE